MFIVFEGGEGAGKSTQARLLANALGAVLTSEPANRLILQQDMPARVEALLFAADRARHVSEVVRPALERGEAVVCDRYIASSLAYQGVGRDLPLHEVEALSEFAVDGVYPDLTVLLDLDPVDGYQRIVDRRRPVDRMEREDLAFHLRVRTAFLDFAAQFGASWLVIDARLPRQEIAAMVLTRVRKKMLDL